MFLSPLTEKITAVPLSCLRLPLRFLRHLSYFIPLSVLSLSLSLPSAVSCSLSLSLVVGSLLSLSRCLLSQSSAGAGVFLLAQELVFSAPKDEHAASRTSDGAAIKYIHGEQLPTGRGSDGRNVHQ
jgi:hypothetical protein